MSQRSDHVRKQFSVRAWITAAGGFIAIAGVVVFSLSPLLSNNIFSSLWAVEPLAYIGAVLVVLGLVVAVLPSLVIALRSWRSPQTERDSASLKNWSLVTQQYFELFHHDLGRPLSRILGKERELRAVLEFSGSDTDTAVKDLLDEIEEQAPNFRLMMSNIQVLVQLEEPDWSDPLEAVEPTQVVRRIIDRYMPVSSESQKEISWWAEPSEFGIVYSSGSSIEHIVTNLVDNAVRWADSSVEVKITKNPSSFFVRVWDDGPGVPSQYAQHLFDRGWTPEIARGEEKSSSGLGLFIGRTLARRLGGDVTVESTPSPDAEHHTAFLLSLPIGEPG